MPTENPYRPPTAPVRDPPRPPSSPIIAVLAGLGVDVGGSTVAGIGLGIVYAVMLAARGMNPEQVRAALTEPDPGSGFFVLSVVVGFSFSVLGGYVCARLVRRDEHRLTAIMAAVSAVVGVALGSGRLSIGLNALMVVLTFVTVIAGGELGRRRNVADARKTGPPAPR